MNLLPFKLSPVQKSNFKWFWLIPILFVADQITKYWASHSLELYQSIPVVKYFNLTLAHNTGAAFSFLSDGGGWQRWFFIFLAMGIIVGLTLFLASLKKSNKISALATALIIGGALGNVWDRMILGYVIDFLDLYFNTWHWPAFNVADIAITGGALLWLWEALTSTSD